MLSQKYHYYFLILAVQLLTYIAYYFPVHQTADFPFPTIIWLWESHVTFVNLQSYNSCFILSSLHHHSKWAQIVDSHIPHNWGISTWQRTWCKSVEYARVHPPLSSVGKAPPPICLLCWESYVSLLSMTVKARASIHIQYFILSSVLWCCKSSKLVWQW